MNGKYTIHTTYGYLPIAFRHYDSANIVARFISIGKNKSADNVHIETGVVLTQYQNGKLTYKDKVVLY